MMLMSNTSGFESSSPANDVRSQTDVERSLEELTRRCRDLEQELAAVSAERDAYSKLVYALWPHQEFDFTKEDIFANLGKQPPLDDFVAELERDLRS